VFGDGRDDVEAAAELLEEKGAIVRVRTRESVRPFETLDEWMAQTVEDCESWQAPDGVRKNNLLVFVISMDRNQGIFYGDTWEPVWPNNAELRIQQEVMRPYFGESDFSGGFVAGMEQAARDIDAFRDPDRGGGPTTVTNKEAADYSGLWRVMLWALIFAVVAALIGFGWFVLNRRRKAESARKVARQEARNAKDAVTTITNRLGDPTAATVRQAQVNKYAITGDERADRLRQALEDVSSNLEQAQNEMATAASSIGQAEDDDLDVGVYELMTDRYTTALEYARAADEANTQIDEISDEIESAYRDANRNIAAAQTRLDGLNASVATLQAEGIHVDDIVAHTTATAQALDKASANVENLTVLQDIELVMDHLVLGEEALGLLNDRREQLARDIPALEVRIDAVSDTVDVSGQAFDHITAAFDDSNWEAVRGNGTEAQKRIGTAETLLSEARDQSGVDQQHWDEAIGSVQKANQALDKAEALLRSITELEKNLNTAASESRNNVTVVRQEIVTAQRYIEERDDDIRESLEDDLRAALDILDEAERLLADPKPNYLHVISLINEADQKGDLAYEQAVGEHEAAERLRRQAASKLSEAERAVSQADEYIDDHDSDVGNAAESYLRDAAGDLANARSSNDPSDVIAHADAAISRANDAYSRARSDFSNAEQERARERRRREEEEERRRRSSYSSSSYGSGSFGSSSSWGSFGGGGGGSSSVFGGGSRGGGGSSSGW
jgi:uncharacterized membrane protein YgcG